MSDNWQLQRSLTPRQLKAVCKGLRLNKAQFARYTGIKIRRAYRMYKGQAEIPASISLLLSSLIAHQEQPVVPRWVKE
jgi:hypothetical protein